LVVAHPVGILQTLTRGRTHGHRRRSRHELDPSANAGGAEYLLSGAVWEAASRKSSEIKQLAQWIGRTPGAVAMKLGNLAGLDPLIAARGLAGLTGASNLDKVIWTELHDNLGRRRS
jgi:hypothetical protein